MSKKRLEEGWLKYRAKVVPSNAGPIQLRETRNAFYAGASVFFSSMMASLSPGPEATEADADVIEELDLELKAFAAELSTDLPS